jgi:MoaA/NifB/PqqE/SkfB family radical SAM enzyme
MKEEITKLLLNKAMNYLDKDPDKNIPRLMKIVEQLDTTHYFGRHIAAVKKYVADPDSVWYKMIRSFWTDVDDEVRKTAFRTFLINACILGVPKKKKLEEKEGVQIPWNIQIDLTTACNLKCKGCWAADYGKTLSLSYEDLESIITQGEEMGTHYYIFSGGEPLMKKDEIIRICENHSESLFMAFTNATLVDEAFADEMLRVKNLVLVISIEGTGEATDFRRGAGTYDACVKALELLKRKKLIYGLSCCYTAQTCQVMGSKEWYDQMVEWGAKFAWYFLYMPVGNSAQPELMVSAEQRKWMYDRVHEFRQTHGIFVLDFWNDGEYVEGCLAAGKWYLHINAAGDIEPCAFIHYADHNIHTSSLRDALAGPLFTAYKEGQPFNENPLRPCPLLDNPDRLIDIVRSSGAKSTDLQNPEAVEHLTDKTRTPSEEWAPIADDMMVDKYGKISGPDFRANM